MTQAIMRRVTAADVVASNIRAEASRQGFTQVALGKALGMSQTQMSKRWKGAIHWQLAELDDVAEVLGVEIVDLVTVPDAYKNTPAEGAGAVGSRDWIRTSNRPINLIRRWFGVRFVLAA